MDELRDLRLMVDELEIALNNNTSGETDSIVPILQKIGAELLTKYEIRVGNITIEPLRVEPYLFKEKDFEDKFTHYITGKDKQRYYGPRQRNRFGKLYIHNGFSGVDIVLSDNDDYAFSFLVKNSRVLIDGNVVHPSLKQNGVASVLKNNGIAVDYDEIVLCKKETPNNAIVFRTIRNGLITAAERDDFKKTEQDKYNQLLVSSFIELKEHTSSQYDFETGYGGDRAVVEYLKDYMKSNPSISGEELEKLREKLYPNGSRTLFVSAFGD